MHIFEKLAEEKIIAAMQRGEFRDLPGAGKPLPADDQSNVPEELRMAYKILKNACIVPPELEMRREISNLQRQARLNTDNHTRVRTLNRLHCLYMHLDASGTRLANLALQDEYYRKVLHRMSGT